MDKDELERWVASGMSVREIAERAGVSKTTIRARLERLGLKTVRSDRLQASRAAIKAGRVEVDAWCPHHGWTLFIKPPSGAFRCGRCRSEAVVRRRRRVKEVLVAEAGGSCLICGYERYIGALHFHHRDPSTKQFAVSSQGIARSIARARAEAKKCVLLCSNCHAEVEAGLATIP